MSDSNNQKAEVSVTSTEIKKQTPVCSNALCHWSAYACDFDAMVVGFVRNEDQKQLEIQVERYQYFTIDGTVQEPFYLCHTCHNAVLLVNPPVKTVN